MSILRAGVVILLLAGCTSGVLALVSRTPAAVRLATPPPDATRAALGARFTERDIARHGAYRGPGYLSFALFTLVQLAALVVLASGPFARLIDATERVPGGVIAAAALGGVALVVVSVLATLPLSFVRGYAIEQAWGLSTQTVAEWLLDQGRALLVGAVTAAVAAAAFIAVVRWQPRLWWLWGWAAFTLLNALLVLIWPVVVAPLFNRFTPLRDDVLEARIHRAASETGVDIGEVLVSDASRRSTAENAYVAGLAGTKRMVLYDTLLRSGDRDETMFVVAHELGHEAERHVLKGVALSSAGILAGFAALAVLARVPSLWAAAGARGVSDPKALPVVALVASLIGLLTLPIQAAVSRTFEARADQIAVAVTDDPAAAVKTFRRLAFANIADLAPPVIAVDLLYTHPPIPDRIRSILETAPGVTGA